MMRIDAHQHFWNYDPVKDSWITEDMSVIKRDFLPADLEPILEHEMDGCIAVQADQSEKETEFLVDLAEKNHFIKGVVGWVDLRDKNIDQRLEHYSHLPPIKGFRHILQGEADRKLMLSKDFKRGIASLGQFDYAYDILILPDQISYAAEVVAAFPEQRFVIDHLAKPSIKTKEIEKWRNDMAVFGDHKNVYCKISGMVTEADWQRWDSTEFTPYLDTVLSVFGVDRVMFGSDWPVCLVAASYRKTYNIVKTYFSQFSDAEQQLIFGGNAITFYKL
jgi:L-fuconolactonase